MEKNPDDRYSTASDLAEDIDNYLGGWPITAMGPRRAYRLRKTLLRHKVTCAAVLAVLLSLTGGVIATSIFASKANAQRLVAKQNEAEAQRQANEAKVERDKTRQALQKLETKKDQHRVFSQFASRLILEAKGANGVWLKRHVDKTLENDQDIEAIDRGLIELTLGVAYKTSGLHPRAKNYFNRAEERFETAGLHVASPERMLLRQYRIFDDIEESDFTLSGYDVALELLPEELRRPALELMNSVKIAYNKLDPDEQRKVSEAVKSAVSGIKITDIFEARDTRASQFLKTGDTFLPSEDNHLTSPEFISEAKTLARESLLELLPHMDVEHLSAEASKLALLALVGAQFHDLAIEFATRADAIDKDLISNVVQATRTSLYGQGDYEAAADVYKQWLPISVDALGDEDADTILLGYWLARSLDKQKKYDKAEAVYRQWLPISVDALGDDHDTTSGLSMWLTGCLYRQAKYADAETTARERLEASKQARGDENVYTIWLGYCLARSLEAQEKYDEAEAVYLIWLEACARSQGKHSQQAQQITSSLIDLYENWGKPEKAEQYRVLLQDEQTSP